MVSAESGNEVPDEVPAALARAGIRSWISRTGQALRHLPPGVILTAMTAAALAPVLVPAAAASGADALQALLAQFGGAGAGYLTAIVSEAVSRDKEQQETPSLSEETLRELLRAVFDAELEGPRAAEARLALAGFVHQVNGVGEALQAANEIGPPELAWEFAQRMDELSRSYGELFALRDDLRRAIEALQRTTAYMFAATREYMEAARQNNDDMRSMIIRFASLHRQIVRSLEAGTTVTSTPADGSWTGNGAESDELSPYPGLFPFEVQDADRFYGRDDLVATLVSALNERLHGDTPLIVMGASGAGKSSILRAGLIPELLNGQVAVPGSMEWPWVPITPGPAPVRDLAVYLATLARIPPQQIVDQLEKDPASAALIVRQAVLAHFHYRHDRQVSGTERPRLLLVIDQFEEVFTLCADGRERKLFIDIVCGIAKGTRQNPPPALVVIGLHIAFMDRCTAHPELAPALRNPVIVGPMTSQGLREAIERPAQQAGLDVAPGLTETMLRDIGAVESADIPGLLTYDPGKLPLLAHALLETWKHREGRRLTVAAYQAAGGIHDAIAATADRVYQSLDEAGKQVARRLLLHLVAVHGDAEDARRRMPRQALLAELPATDKQAAGRLLDELVGQRLLTADQDTVQLAHEALLRYWPRLAGWLAEDRDWRRDEQRLAEHAREWADRQRDDDLLLRGTSLATVTEKLDDGRRAELGELEKEFLVAAERREARQRRAARSAGVVLTAITVLAVIGGLIAFYSYTQARQQRAAAQSRQLSAEMAQLTAEAAQLRASNPQISLLFSLAAYRIEPTAPAAGGLLSEQADFYTAYLPDPTGSANAVAYSPADGLLAAAGNNNELTVWHGASQRPAASLPGTSAFESVAFAPDQRLLAGGEGDGDIAVWDATSLRPVRVLRTPDGQSVNAVVFVPGRPLLLSAGYDGVIWLWNTRTWREEGLFDVGATVNGLAISSDGTWLAAACSDRSVRVWNLRKPAQPPRTLHGHDEPVRAVAFSPSGTLLASASDDGTIRLWDPRTGAARGVLSNSTSPVHALAFNPAGTLLASGGEDDAVRLWDVQTLTQVRALTGPANTVTGVAFSPDGSMLASADADGTVGLWDITAPPQPGGNVAAVVAAAPRLGTVVATIGVDSQAVDLWRQSQSAAYAQLPRRGCAPGGTLAMGGLPPSVALSPDGGTMAVTTPDSRVVQLWSTRTECLIMPPLIAPGTVTSVAYHALAHGELVAAGSLDGDVYLWTPPVTAEAVQLSGDLTEQVTSVAFSPDGRLLAAGCADGSVLLASRQANGAWISLQPLGGVDKPVGTVAFSPSGTLLAAGSATGAVELWQVTDSGTATPLPALAGPTEAVLSLAFSDHGTLAASAADDSITLWNVSRSAQATTLARLTGLSDPTTVAWEPGSQTLLGAAADGTLLAWDTDPAVVAARICASPLRGDMAGLASFTPGITLPPLCPGT